jgi:hypothetical protein
MGGTNGSHKRKYRHVYWHKTAKVWVWHRKGCIGHGQHPNQVVAAQMAAAAFNIPVAKLRLSPAKQQPAQQQLRLYRHVCYHTKSKTWVVQRSGCFVGSHTHQHAAAKVANKAFGIPLSRLKLKQPTKSRPSLLKHKLCFRFMWAIYREPGAMAVEAKVPGDLEDLFQSSHTGKMMEHFPELLLPYVVAKYAPHREALATSAAELASQRATMPLSKWLHNVLQRTMRKLSGAALSDIWTRNVGRNGQFHSGLVPFVHSSLGLLKCCSKRSKALILGNNRRLFQLTNAKAPLLEMRLESVAKFGLLMAKAGVPRTVRQWAKEMQQLQVAARNTPGLRHPAAYRTLWVIRSWLMYMMREANVPRLQLDKTCTVGIFSTLFPDNKAWILKFAGRGRQEQPMVEVLVDLGCPYQLQCALQEHVSR